MTRALLGLMFETCEYNDGDSAINSMKMLWVSEKQTVRSSGIISYQYIYIIASL